MERAITMLNITILSNELWKSSRITMLFLTPLIFDRVLALEMEHIHRESNIRKVRNVSNHVREHAVIVIKDVIGFDHLITECVFHHFLMVIQSAYQCRRHTTVKQTTTVAGPSAP
jgi:hypothetical protein